MLVWTIYNFSLEGYIKTIYSSTNRDKLYVKTNKTLQKFGAWHVFVKENWFTFAGTIPELA